MIVSVNNVEAVVSAGLDQTADEGSIVTFGGGFTDVGSADSHEVVWNFGDGYAAAGTLAPSHVYADNGVYMVTVTVTDDDGASSADTLVVTVSNVADRVVSAACVAW